MSNVVEFKGGALAAKFGTKLDKLRKIQKEVIEQPTAGPQFARISTDKRQFSILADGEAKVIRTSNGAKAEVLNVVILGSSPGVYRTYYKGKFDPKAAEKEAPMCWSPNGIAPSRFSHEPQADTCAKCKHSVYGSKINEAGNKSFACSSARRVLVVSAGHVDGPVYMLNISATKMREFNQYVKRVDREHGLPIQAVVTELSFDEASSVPVLNFREVTPLTDEQLEIVLQRVDEPEVVEFMAGDMDTEGEGVTRVAVPDAEEEQAAPEPTATPAPTGRRTRQASQARQGFAAEEKAPEPEPAPAGDDELDLNALMDF